MAHFIQGTVHIFFSFQERSWHKRQELTLGTIRLIEIDIFDKTAMELEASAPQFKLVLSLDKNLTL